MTTNNTTNANANAAAAAAAAAAAGPKFLPSDYEDKVEVRSKLGTFRVFSSRAFVPTAYPDELWLYAGKGNWDVYRLVDITDTGYEIGQYLRTEWRG
jgi:hypothetical protein